MALVDFSAYKISETTTTPISQQQINLFLDAIQAALNAITDDQIVPGSIGLDKVENGAVPDSLVTIVGAVNSIPMTDASGNLIINGSIKVIQG